MIMTVLAPLPAAESWKTRTSAAIGIQGKKCAARTGGRTEQI